METKPSTPKKRIGASLNGAEVWVDMQNSHAATHLRDEPLLEGLIIEVLSQKVLRISHEKSEHDLGRPIGYTDVVETTNSDEIVYAMRPNRDVYSRFVKHRQPELTSYITIDLLLKEPNSYELISAWIGRIGEPFPGNKYETPQSRTYWNSHALVWGRQAVVPGTETPQCPW